MWETVSNNSITIYFNMTQKERMNSFKTKNYKLKRLTQTNYHGQIQSINN